MAEASPTPKGARSSAGGRRGGFRVGRVFGIDIRVDWSLLIVFALIVFNLGAGALPSWHPDWGPLVKWVTAFAAAVLFFASILAHELAHALVARTQGVVVPRITLFLFGGVAELESEPATPGAELLIAIVGPITSFVLGVLGTVFGLLLAGPSLLDAGVTDVEAALSGVGPVATLALWLGPINVILAVFNMVPGFPLDGGRVLRALVWWGTGDATLATRVAATAGSVFAWVLITYGIVQIFAGAIVNGIWMLLIGWFLHGAARSSLRQHLLRDALRGVRVADIMRTHFDSVPPEMSLAELVRSYWIASDQPVFPIVLGPLFLGVVGQAQLLAFPPERWPETPLSEVMVPLAELETLPPSASADEVLAAMTRSGTSPIPVVQGDTLLGWVGHDEIFKWLTVREWTQRRPEMPDRFGRVRGGR